MPYLSRNFALTQLFTLTNILGAVAKTCFENKDYNDYTLNSALNENALFKMLTETCGIFRDEYNDCAIFFTNTEHFGRSAFGFPTCNVSYHDINQPDQCIMDVVAQHCEDGWTTLDTLTMMGIFMGVLICCCVTQGYQKLCNQQAVASDTLSHQLLNGEQEQEKENKQTTNNDRSADIEIGDAPTSYALASTTP